VTAAAGAWVARGLATPGQARCRVARAAGPAPGHEACRLGGQVPLRRCGATPRRRIRHLLHGHLHRERVRGNRHPWVLAIRWRQLWRAGRRADRGPGRAPWVPAAHDMAMGCRATAARSRAACVRRRQPPVRCTASTGSSS